MMIATDLRLLAYVPGLPDNARDYCLRQLGDLVKLNEKNKPDLSRQYKSLMGQRDWVDIDMPRDTYITNAIVAAVKGYAVSDLNGNIVARFDKLADAELARGNARLDVSVAVDFGGEDTAPVGRSKQ